LAKDVGQFKDDQFALPQHQQNVQSLQLAQQALQLTETGRSQATMHDMYSFLVAHGAAPQSLTDDVANFDLAKKYLLQYASRQGSAAHSDLQLNTSEAANPNTSMSQAAALDVVKTNIGRERQAIAQVMAAPDQTGIGYGAHAQTFSNLVDPRGFAADAYSPAELAQVEKTLTTAQAKAKFFRAMAYGQRYGFFGAPTTPPEAAPAPANPPSPGPGGA
jgi:hypothetical protein